MALAAHSGKPLVYIEKQQVLTRRRTGSRCDHRVPGDGELRQIGGEDLHTQASIHVGCEHLMDPAGIFAALFQAVIPNPQGDDGDESRFLFGNHDEASREPAYILESPGKRGWNGGLHSMRFLGLCNKLHTKGGNTRRTCRGHRRVLSHIARSKETERRVS